MARGGGGSCESLADVESLPLAAPRRAGVCVGLCLCARRWRRCGRRTRVNERDGGREQAWLRSEMGCRVVSDDGKARIMVCAWTRPASVCVRNESASGRVALLSPPRLDGSSGARSRDSDYSLREERSRKPQGRTYKARRTNAERSCS